MVGKVVARRRRRQADVSDASLARVAVASCAGTTIEFYDFFVYGTAAALVFPKVFFPALGAAAGALASFATLGVAFVARPLGALVCGHFGDRFGRKNTLVATLLLMGVATVLIGLLPSSAAIGVAAPVLLAVLRFLQGFAVGGEWAGAALFAAEYAPERQRGRYAVFPQLGPALGFMLASGTFLLVDVVVGAGSEAFLAYGWRIPFLSSAVLVFIGLFVRMVVAETPAFREYQAELEAGGVRRPETAPLRKVLRTHLRQVLLGGGVLTVLFALFYVATAYLTSFGTSAGGAGLSRSTVLELGIAAGAVLASTTIAAGVLSDRIGRRRTIIAGFVIAVPLVLVLFGLLGGGSGVALGVTLATMLGVYGVAYGPVGAYLPELFTTDCRYTGAGLAYNLGGVLGGAVVPLAAAALSAAHGVFAVGVLMAGVALVSLASAVALRPRTEGPA
ncbi:Sugar phosphate permease [Amycolatopsis pretoriensis]|uniref:Sugar phosphate permease n=1 Tax=Amycolatopsis pretoriensis TaxID=218821 RepID=A0A1H5RIG6_9PSEU|nr:MFS transporter [Amycolatopsis pretoriensis]SEF38090.1 Sugar phosphate permease [Amycolatopsis pretoriensis]